MINGNNNTTCNTSLDSFFSTTIIDNKGNSVTDINAGLNKLFKTINEKAANIYESQNYLVKEFEEAYPELVAKNSILHDTKYWWWILILNALENPFTDVKPNWVYSINSETTINGLIEAANTAVEDKTTERTGNIIELN